MTGVRGHGTLLPTGQHPQLVSLAIRGVAALRSLDSEIESSREGVAWHHHAQFAESAVDLADHLGSALAALDGQRFPSAFAALRTALEHQVLDRLLLLANRYRQRISPVSVEQFDRWVEEHAAGADWAVDVETLDRVKNGAVLVRRGHDVRDTDGNVVEQISPYWHVAEEHNPTLGPPSAQAKFHDGIGALKDEEARARENRDRYTDFFRWESMLDNLELNELLPVGERVRLEVHYRFLSAFAHPTRHGYDLIRQGAPGVGRVRPGEHEITELALLYVIAITRVELESFVEYIDRRPTLLRLREPEHLKMLTAELRTGAAHLRFLGDRPCEFDYFTEANRRVWKSWDKAGPIPGNRQRPEEITASEVGYYADPLKRLGQLHLGGNEMTTGFSFRAMW